MLDSGSGYEALLAKDMARWNERLAELRNEIAIRETERDDLSRRIAAAETILGYSSGSDADNSSIRVLIKELMLDGIPRRPKDIRRDLVARGLSADDPRFSTRSGGFYNSLARLVLDGELMKSADGQYWNPAKSSGPRAPRMEDLLK